MDVHFSVAKKMQEIINHWNRIRYIFSPFSAVGVVAAALMYNRKSKAKRCRTEKTISLFFFIGLNCGKSKNYCKNFAHKRRNWWWIKRLFEYREYGCALFGSYPLNCQCIAVFWKHRFRFSHLKMYFTFYERCRWHLAHSFFEQRPGRKKTTHIENP